MNGVDWIQFTDGLNEFELFRLQQAINETNIKRGQLAFPAQHDQAYEASLSTFPCISPTLQQSTRSSYQSNSALSGDTVSLGPISLSLPHIGHDAPEQLKGDENAAWNTAQVIDSVPAHSPQPHETSQGNPKEMPAPGHKGPWASNEDDSQLNPRFFCTYCCEHGIASSFKTKHDWKRHEKHFHETGYEWHCQVHGCLEVFARDKDFKNHCEKSHGPKPDTREIKIPIPEKRVYACGFKSCMKLTYNWKDRCNHVARCMSDGSAEWDYTSKMCALLKHPDIRPTWRLVKSRWCDQLKLHASLLRWDCKTSRSMRMQLECHNFEIDLESFLERLFKLGVPRYPVSQSFHSYPTRLNPQSSRPPTATSAPTFGPQDTTNAYVQSFQPTPMLSYADQRYHGASNFDSMAVHDSNDYGKRNSVTMLDAPALTDGDVDRTEGDQGHAAPDQKLLTVNDFLYSPAYSTNTTPPLSDHLPGIGNTPTQETSRISPRCKLIRKRKEWLSPRRSQQFQQRAATDHPDLAVNYSGPVSPFETDTTVVPANFCMGGVHNYKS